MQTRTCFQCGQNLFVKIVDDESTCAHCGALNEREVSKLDAIVSVQPFQKVIEFRARRFWSSRLDMSALNDKIRSLNERGWVVRSMTSSSTLLGVISAYTLLIELKDGQLGPNDET